MTKTTWRAGLRALLIGTAISALGLAACEIRPPKDDTKASQSADGDNGAQTDGAEDDTAKENGTEVVRWDKNPFPSTYKPYPGVTTAIVGATALTGTGEKIENATVLLQDGKIAAIGSDVAVPEGVAVIDGTGKFVTPGIIDVHSHLGVYPSPSDRAHSDGNEIVKPNTANVWAEHSIWPQDPGFARALAGGVTSLMILPGSANLFGGRGVVVKNVYARTMQGMKFPGAPYTLKMACGENPKRVYGTKGRAPYTRMGNVSGYRTDWIGAQEYKRKWERYWEKAEAGEDATPPSRDLLNETMMGVLEGEILVHMHCYRADEMVIMLDVAQEFDYKITAFHHATSAYKIADYLRENDVCAMMWADWWGFKLEANDAIRENAALVHKAGACAIIHSDSAVGIQRLNQEAAKAMADGRKMGLDIKDEDAIAWITSNAAKSLGIGDKTGALKEGLNADVVLWSANPFSVYALAEKVFIDGALLYDRSNPEISPRSDFELGQLDWTNTGGAGQ